MSHPSHYDALVLRTFDIGEADRFCLLFTRERGRVAARAYGARRPRSRIGPALLPLQRALVSMRESPHQVGIVTAAISIAGGLPPGNLSAFFRAECGTELLLALLHDEHPFPDLFEAAVTFLQRASEGDHILLAFAFHMLSVLGLLPEPPPAQALSVQERIFIATARHFPLRPLPALTGTEHLRRFCAQILGGHLNAPLHGELASAVFGMKERDAHPERDSREHRPDSYLPAGRT